MELAIWKSKITEQYGHDNHHNITNMHKKRRIDSVSKSQCRTDSVAMVRIIVPNVISFLTYVGNNIVDDNDGGEDSYNYNETDDSEVDGNHDSDDDSLYDGGNDN